MHSPVEATVDCCCYLQGLYSNYEFSPIYLLLKKLPNNHPLNHIIVVRVDMLISVFFFFQITDKLLTHHVSIGNTVTTWLNEGKYFFLLDCLAHKLRVTGIAEKKYVFKRKQNSLFGMEARGEFYFTIYLRGKVGEIP